MFNSIFTVVVHPNLAPRASAVMPAPILLTIQKLQHPSACRLFSPAPAASLAKTFAVAHLFCPCPRSTLAARSSPFRQLCAATPARSCRGLPPAFLFLSLAFMLCVPRLLLPASLSPATRASNVFVALRLLPRSAPRIIAIQLITGVDAPMPTVPCVVLAARGTCTVQLTAGSCCCSALDMPPRAIQLIATVGAALCIRPIQLITCNRPCPPVNMPLGTIQLIALRTARQPFISACACLCRSSSHPAGPLASSSPRRSRRRSRSASTPPSRYAALSAPRRRRPRPCSVQVA